jgi:hypothetical protein
MLATDKHSSLLQTGRFCCRDLTISGSSKLSKSVDGDFRARTETSVTTVSSSATTHLTFEHEKQTSALFYK